MWRGDVRGEEVSVEGRCEWGEEVSVEGRRE